MIHLDIKNSAQLFQRTGHRITGDRRGQSNARARKQGGYGWEYVHVAIDDHSRLSFADIDADEIVVTPWRI